MPVKVPSTLVSTTGQATDRGDMPGKDAAIIGIIDSGFDLNHPNLNYVDRSLHFNAAEFLDRRRAAQSLTGVRAVRYYNAGDAIRPHGTSIAGVAAAIRRDARQPPLDSIAPGFPVMPMKIGAKPDAARVAAAIGWAIEHGARVINLSFGVLASPELYRAINQAWDHGIVLCAAAGNYSALRQFRRIDFPARHPRVIAVGAINSRGHRKVFHSHLQRDWGSLYGEELDVVARGEGLNTLDEVGLRGSLPGDYALDAFGTSVASPQVAGLAALLWAIQPQLTNQQVRDLIEGSCLQLKGYRFGRELGRNWRWNREVGYGQVQPSAAIRKMKS